MINLIDTRVNWSIICFTQYRRQRLLYMFTSYCNYLRNCDYLGLMDTGRMGGRGRGITGLCNLNRVNDGLAQLLQSPHGKRHLESSALSTAGLGEGGGGRNLGLWWFYKPYVSCWTTALYYVVGFGTVHPANYNLMHGGLRDWFWKECRFLVRCCSRAYGNAGVFTDLFRFIMKMLTLREVGRRNTKSYVSQSVRHGPRIVMWEFCYIIPKRCT